MIRMIVIDPEVLFLDALTYVLKKDPAFELLAALSDPKALPEACEQHRPDLVLMEIELGEGIQGIQEAKLLLHNYPETKVVLMTNHPDITYVEQAKKAGVTSFVYKNVRAEHLISVLKNALRNYQTIPSPETSKSPFTKGNLTDRELLVIRHILAGESRSEVARSLGYSETTIKRTISSILNKTEYDNIHRLVLDISNKRILKAADLKTVRLFKKKRMVRTHA